MRRARTGLFRLIAVLSVFVLVLAACETDSAGPEAGVTIEDLQAVEDRLVTLEERVGGIEEDVGAFDGGTEDGVTDDELEQPVSEILGSEVTVSGEVSDPMNDNAFAFRIGGDFWSFDEGVLVISSTGEPFEAGISEGELVQVTGTAMQFVIADFESEFGVDLADEDFVDFEQEVAIAAEPGNVDGLVPSEDELADEEEGG